MKRRKFIQQSFIAGAGMSLFSSRTRSLFGSTTDPLFKISLAEWSWHRALFSGEINHLDFAYLAKIQYGIDGIEYVNQFFMDKAKDKEYLKEMKKRCTDNSVRSLLIMCDNEGRLGDPDEAKRQQAVENHYKWAEAAEFLGCHSIRVNAGSEGSYDEQQKLVADGLRKLVEFGATLNINIIVENHGGLSSNGKWLSGVMKLVDHPRGGTLPDFGNFRVSETEIYDRYQGVQELMTYAKGVSAKSSDFDEQGYEIRTDYLKMMRIVLAAGYHGYVGIEYGGDKFSEGEGIRKTLDLLKKVREILEAENKK